MVGVRICVFDGVDISFVEVLAMGTFLVWSFLKDLGMEIQLLEVEPSETFK